MAEGNTNGGTGINTGSIGQSILDIDYENLTPGMKQYQEVKKVHPDCLVMLRMGDFYEMFYADAVTAARELEITLTARGKGETRAPLAGVPFHALETYLGRLVKKGYKVAIVEQLEDPKKVKGLVKRGLVRIVTPGTVIESSLLQENENNYVACVTAFGEEYALALADVSTGEFSCVAVQGMSALLQEIVRMTPSECVMPKSLGVDTELVERIKGLGCFVNMFEDYFFRSEKARELLLEHFKLKSLESFGLEGEERDEKKRLVSVTGGLLKYLFETQKNSLSHIQKISVRANAQTMMLDSGTFRNLELVRNIRDGSTRGTLLSVLDKTITPMGARLLRAWLKTPLLKKELIEKRLDAIEAMNQNIIVREEVILLLKKMYDIERLIGRINYGNATPRDVLALKQSLQCIPAIKMQLNDEQLGNVQGGLLSKIAQMPELGEVVELLERAIREDAPLTVREGGMIKAEYNAELNSLQEVMQNSKQYLQRWEEEEKKKTGISSLRVGFTNVFGYFIEVTRKNAGLVPEHYIRKQTTVNTERYITEELKKEEEKILGAEEKSVELEYQLFQEILVRIREKTQEIQEVSVDVAVLDVVCGLSVVAQQQQYVRPKFVSENVLQIRRGRHTVVEQLADRFIANDVVLQDGEMMIITGPNMAGKSTIMRQTALIVLLAQMGSFVPAQEVVMGIVDRIFTRVGAYDDLSSGQSTFMIEMTETAYILNNATSRSLIVLDEIGRGTSTFDGVSIAWSVAEHIYNRIKAKTLFATHYHVMNKLAEKFAKIINYNVAVKETKKEIIFLHTLVEGGTDDSYGVYVAKLAGLPSEVLERAEEIQQVLEKDDEMMHKLKAKRLQEQKSLGEF